MYEAKWKLTTRSLKMNSPPAVYNLPDNSMTEQSDSMETHSSTDDIALSADTPTDQSGGFICGERQAVGVAEAALQDGEEKADMTSSLQKETSC